MFAVTFVFFCLSDKPQDKFQTSSNIPHSTDAEMTDIGRESEALDDQNANVSPKRPNEDIIPTPKKKVLDVKITLTKIINATLLFLPPFFMS